MITIYELKSTIHQRHALNQIKTHRIQSQPFLIISSFFQTLQSQVEQDWYLPPSSKQTLPMWNNTTSQELLHILSKKMLWCYFSWSYIKYEPIEPTHEKKGYYKTRFGKQASRLLQGVSIKKNSVYFLNCFILAVIEFAFSVFHRLKKSIKWRWCLPWNCLEDY